MGTNTKIEWADQTINPIVGCTKCSPGCDNCYAEIMATRLAKMPTTADLFCGAGGTPPSTVQPNLYQEKTNGRDV